MVYLRRFTFVNKYLIGIFIASSLSVLLPPSIAFAALTPESCFTTTGTTTKTITDYDVAGVGCGLDVEVPDTIGGSPVTSITAANICSGGFSCKGITSIILPSGLTNIGQYVFYADKLTSVTLPNGLTSLGQSAFGVNELTSINIPPSLTNIGHGAFVVNKLTSVTIPSSVNTIGSQAFAHNDLTSVTLPSSITSLWGLAFENNEITSFTINGSPGFIGNNVLQNNPVQTITYNGTVYTAPSGQTQPADSCFTQNAGALTEYYLNDIVRIRDTSAACMARNIIIPNSIAGTPITAIGDFGLDQHRLIGVSLPTSITSIGYQSLYDNRIISFTIPPTITNIGAYAFGMNKLTSINIPSSAINIGSHTFMNNELTSATLPSNMTAIPEYMFYNNKLITIDIPNTVATIGDAAFIRNRLSSANIPDNLTSIGRSVFAENNLTEITIPTGVTIIGDSAFYGNSLREVAIPNSVTSIDEWAFAAQNPGGGVEADKMWSNNAQVNKSVLETIWYAKLYTADPGNPNNLEDKIILDTMELDGEDLDYDEPANVGGHLINPASVTLNFTDNYGSNVQSAKTFTTLTSANYKVIDGPTIPFPVDPYNRTSGESQAINDALANYYRIGDTFTYSAPLLDGVTPTPSQYSFVLGASNVMRDFVYASQGSLGNGGQLASTGLSVLAVVSSCLIIIGLSSVLLIRNKILT